jgi:pyrophosphatase PpaX
MSLPLSSPAAILFDLDGTLIDSIELIVRSFQHTTEAHLGAPREREQIIPVIGLSLINELERIAPGKGQEMLQTYRTFLVQNHDDLIGEYEGVTEMLDRLAEHRLPLAIVTAKARISAAPTFARFQLEERMQVVVTYEDTENHKPHPEPLLLAASRIGVEPTTCWYVGDSTHDMQAAKAAGMYAVGAAWGPYGYDQLAPLADVVLQQPGDLLALLPAID